MGPDHTTFDIPFDRPISKDELAYVNRRVMEKVRAALPFHESQKSYKDAVAQGAMHCSTRSTATSSGSSASETGRASCAEHAREQHRRHRHRRDRL